MNILEVNDLEVKINNFTLNIEELSVSKGEIFYLKGKNGVGKTTFLKTILGFMVFKGFLKCYTKDISGFLGNDFLIPYLYPNEYFRFLNSVSKNKNFAENYENFSNLLNFNYKDRKYIRDLSEGNRKKVGIISILSAQSDIMIFDEPFENLDEKSSESLCDLFRKKKDHCTIIYTSHQIKDIFDDSYEIK